MSDFYRKHKNLISVLLVAVFVLGGMIYSSTKIFALTETQIDWANSFQGTNQISNVNSINVGYSGNSPLEIAQQLVADAVNSNYINQGDAAGWVTFITENPTDPRAEKFYQDFLAFKQQKQANSAGQTVQNAQPGVNNQSLSGTANTPAPKSNKPNQFEQMLGSMIAWFLYYIAVGLGWIMMLITKVMLVIAVFNSFLSQPAVQVGWTITRDICNNFFIIFMMIMAAGVTLHLPNYAWRAMLPKILINAVLINFSMLMTGVLIDVSQIIMLTFASPLSTVQGYNIIISAFGLPDAMNLQSVLAQWSNGGTGALNISGKGIEFLDIVAALLFAIIVTIVAIVVITCIAVIFVYRIIMLMFLVVLSPLYFLSRASNVKTLEGIAGEWWGLLGKMLAVGPAMMFFLYLSFMTMAAVNNLDNSVDTSSGQTAGLILNDPGMESQVSASAKAKDVANPLPAGTDNSAQYVALSKMASVTGVLNFMIVIGLLWGSLMMGQRFGEKAGSVASSGMGKLLSGAKKYSGFNLGKKGVAQLQKAPGAIVKGAGAKLGTGALGATTAATRAAGWVAGKMGMQTVSEGLGKLGAVGGQWRQDVLGARRKSRIAQLSKLMGKVGLGSDEAKQKWGEFTDTDLAKRSKALALGAGSALAAGGTAMATGGAGLIPGLATAAAGYLGGGGRLAEIWLGQKGIARAKEREEKEKKINAAKAATSGIVSMSEEVRDKDIESETQALIAGDVNIRGAKDDRDTAEKWMSNIENAKVNNRNRYTGNGLDQEIKNELAKANWSSGQEITDEMLENAKDAVKNGAEWGNKQRDIDWYENNYAQPIRDKQALAHQKRVNDELDKSKSGKSSEEQGLIEVEKARFNTEFSAKAQLNVDTSRIKKQLEQKLRDIDTNAQGLDAMSQLRAKQKARDDSTTSISEANNNYAKSIESAQHQLPKARAIDSFLADYKPYAHENWVSQGVAKDAKIMQQAIKDLVSAMESAGAELLDGFDQTSRGSFYSNNGQTETQFRSIKAMADSTLAMQNLINALAAMPKEISGEQAQLVKELKQGIAAYKKAGGDTTKLASIIALLDQKKGTNKDGTKIIDDKSVADYENEVKPKK